MPSIDSLPPSTRLGLTTLRTAFAALSRSDTPMPIGDIYIRIENELDLTDWARSETVGGNVRWKNQLQFHSLYAVKAGLLIKDRKSGWSLTPKGHELTIASDDQFFFDCYWAERIKYQNKRTG